MPLVKWENSFSVNIEKFDKQHQVLLKIINELYDLIDISENRKELRKLIHRLRLYTIQHFTAEEYYFDFYDYPNSNEHKREHKVFIKRVSEYEEASLTGNDEILSEILDFLVHWLVSHIKTADKKYSNFLNKKGIE